VKQAGGASRAQERSIRTELVQVLDATQVAQDAHEGIQLDATKSGGRRQWRSEGDADGRHGRSRRRCLSSFSCRIARS
jgi:hypothetical protein